MSLLGREKTLPDPRISFCFQEKLHFPTCCSLSIIPPPPFLLQDEALPLPLQHPRPSYLCPIWTLHRREIRHLLPSLHRQNRLHLRHRTPHRPLWRFHWAVDRERHILGGRFSRREHDEQASHCSMAKREDANRKLSEDTVRTPPRLSIIRGVSHG